MRPEYCPQCGTKTVLRPIGDEGPTPYCVPCERPLFDLPAPGVLVLVMNDEGRVVLLRQEYVSKDHWVLVAGYAKSGETIEDVVCREVKEETGLDVVEMRYVRSFWHEGKDALLLGFFARADGTLTTESTTEVDDLVWAAFDDVADRLRPGSMAMALYGDVRRMIDE
jgi:NAD+ diphosphatase